METHNFPVDAKVRICLTLTGKARLWYETLGTVQLDWTALQDCFQQQYSKFGNTRDQYFHVWRSIQYDESTHNIDSCYIFMLLVDFLIKSFKNFFLLFLSLC